MSDVKVFTKEQVDSAVAKMRARHKETMPALREKLKRSGWTDHMIDHLDAAIPGQMEDELRNTFQRTEQ